MDVQPSAGGSFVRHIRLAPPAAFCPNTATIRVVETEANVEPSRLVGSANPCSLNEKDFNHAITEASFKGSTRNESPGFVIVASCGGDERIVRIPQFETLDLKALRKQSSTVFEIVRLYSSLEKRFSHGELTSAKYPKDQELELAGQKFLPDLKSGRFDRGFEQNRLKEILAMYPGPVRTVSSTPKLVDFDKWKFKSYTDPVYPGVLGFGKKVDTKVELEFYVNPTNGNITSFKIVHGSEQFRTPTTDAVVEWIFDPAEKLLSPFKLTLDYSIGCKVTPIKP